MELLTLVKLILMVVIIISSIFAVLRYVFKRYGNQKRLQNGVDYNQSVRQLTTEECELLTPYLNNTSLVSQQVFVIRGQCIRHSLASISRELSYYFVIGNLEVLFPYAMEYYTTEDNIVEVVLTEHKALVISLNGYNLAKAKAQLDLALLRNEQWLQGELGNVQTVIDDSAQHKEYHAQFEKLILQAKNNQTKIIEQRDETRLECARKQATPLWVISVISLILGVMLLFSYRDDRDFWIVVISILSFIISFFFYFYKRKPQIDKVNRVQVTINEKNSQQYQLLISDSISVSYPPHWQTFLPEKTTKTIDMDITVNGKYLLAYDNFLSINNEIEQYGSPKFWQKNAVMFIVTLLLFSIFSVFSHSVKDNLLFSYHFMTRNIESWTFDSWTAADESFLKVAPIKKGDWINLNLYNASCDVANINHCNKVFIIKDLGIALNEQALLYNEMSNPLLNTAVLIIKDDEVEEREQTYLSNLNSFDDSTESNSHYVDIYSKLLYVNNLVFVTDVMCQIDRPVCKQLKEILLTAVKENYADELDSWPTLLVYSSKNRDLNIIMPTKTVDEIERLFNLVHTKLVADKENEFLDILRQAQQKDDNLTLLLVDGYSASVQVSGANYGSNKINYYHSILLGFGNVNIYGLVTDIRYNNNGTIKSLMINPDQRYQFTGNTSIPQPLLNIVLFIALILVAASQLFICFRKIYVNTRRLKRIKAGYRQFI